MKTRVIIISCLFCLLSCHIDYNDRYLSSISALPSLNILLPDNKTQFNISDLPNDKPILLLYFGPYCPHSRFEIRTLLQSNIALNGFRLVFLTGAAIGDLNTFIQSFHLDCYSNSLTIGVDKDHSFPKMFQSNGVPFLAIYNQQRQLVKIYHGEVPLSHLLAALRNCDNAKELFN